MSTFQPLFIVIRKEREIMKVNMREEKEEEICVRNKMMKIEVDSLRRNRIK